MSQEVALPSILELFLATHLYKKLNLGNLSEVDRIDYLLKVAYPSDGFDVYCIDCARESYFTLAKQPELMTGSQRPLQTTRNQRLGIQQRLEPYRVKSQPNQFHSNVTQQQQEISSLRQQLSQLERTEREALLKDHLFSVELTCTRNEEHKLTFIFLCLAIFFRKSASTHQWRILIIPKSKNIKICWERNIQNFREQ